MTKNHPPAATIAFIDTFGRIAAGDHLPAIAGRIAGYLLLATEPVSFGELERALGISRGSVSTNTRLLEELGTVERIAVAGERERRFRIAPDASHRTAEWHLRKTSDALDAVRDAARDIRDAGDLPPEVAARIDAMEDFYALWAGQLEVFRDRVVARGALMASSAAGAPRPS